MSDIEITMVPKDLYYHEVAYVRGLEARNAKIVAALEDIAIYGCGMLSQPPALNGDNQSWRRMRIAAYEQRARAALAAAGHKP